MSVDAVLLCITKDAGQEGIAHLVVFPRFGNLLGDGVLVLCEKVLGEAGQARLGSAIWYVQMVKDFGNAGSGPEFKLQPCLLLNIRLYALNDFEEVLLQALGGIKVNPHTLPRHLYAERKDGGFHFKDRPQVLFGQFQLKYLPQIERELCICLGVLSDKASR